MTEDFRCCLPPTGRLVGVHSPHGGLVDDVRHVIGRRHGGSPCALCTMSNGASLRARRRWLRAVAALPLPFIAVQLADIDETTAALVSIHNAPAVAHISDDGSARLLLDAQALDACHGSPEAFADAVTLSLTRMAREADTVHPAHS